MRLLLAEDDQSLRNVLVRILEKNNYCVDAVDNGRDALEFLQTGFYDAVIMDIMMPYIDGVTVVSRIRANKNTVPVLLLTAKSEIDDKIIGLDTGANDYLTKPFDVRELLARIRVLTRKADMQQSNLISFGNVMLDTKAFVLSTSKGNYQLSNKEYQTMNMLMRNPNKVISASEFLERIWPEDSIAEENTIWTYISYLRRKLESIDADITIHTIRGAGYILEDKYGKD
mgnify:CR=1 FL=1